MNNRTFRQPGVKRGSVSAVTARGATLALLTVSALLAGCPGGDVGPIVGSDPVDGPIDSPIDNPGGDGTPSEYTVSGTLSLAQNSTIDSDTNDPNQVGRTSNNSFTTAQSIPNPTLAIGYLNVPGEGPEGPNKAGGDTVDGYQVHLSEGQVVEVQFSADPSTIDVDLYIYSADRQIVGASIGLNSYECVRIREEGDYIVAPLLYTTNGASVGGTVYQMRIAAPGSSSACSNATVANAANILPGEVIARQASAEVVAARRADKSAAVLPAPVAIKGALSADRSALLGVPADLGTMLVSNKLSKSTDPTLAVTRPEGIIPARTQRVLETVAYAKMLSKSGEYLYAYPNFEVQALQVQSFPPNDRDYVNQRWHYDAIDLSGAINLLAGQSPAPTYEPIVAVVDSGIVADHPDLQNQIIGGYDFVRDTTAAGDGNGIDNNPDDASDSSSSVFHGSHVAGTVAAQTYNGIGGAGVAPMAKIMPMRVLGKTGTGGFYDIIQGVRFAAGLANDSGTLPPRKADVINMSLGGSATCTAAIQTEFRAVRDAGVIAVAASGNESSTSRLVAVGIPANCDDVIAIGATNPTRTRAYYSNGGSDLTAVAPGGDTRRSTTGTGLADGVYSTVASISNGQRQPTYTVMQGTSMASPHAAGIFALMRYVAPNVTPAQIVEAISNGTIVDDVGDTGRDNETGYGQLNALKAVQYANQIAGVAPPDGTQVTALPSALSISDRNVSVEFELRAEGDDAESVVSVTASNTNITVAPKAGAVDGTTGLGTYVVSASASADAATSFANVVVTVSPARTFEIPVTLGDSTVGGSGGNLGPIYVLGLDADDDQNVVAQASIAAPVDGVYRYTMTVPGTARLVVIAGSDTDNDGTICREGEACGGYPILGDGQVEVLVPTGNLTDIDFSLVPFGGINAEGAAAAKAGSVSLLPAVGTDATGIRRLDRAQP